MSELHGDLARLAAALAALAPDRGIVVAYLFGSAVEDRTHRESDVDLGILFDRGRHPTRRDRFEAGIRLAGALEPEIGGRRVDLVVLDDAPPGIARRIVTTGRLLHCADAAAEHAFRRDAQLRAADLEPFLRRTRRRKLEAIAR